MPRCQREDAGSIPAICLLTSPGIPIGRGNGPRNRECVGSTPLGRIFQSLNFLKEYGMNQELQQLKEQLETVNLRFINVNELIEMKMKEAQGFYDRQQILKRKIAELEKR